MDRDIRTWSDFAQGADNAGLRLIRCHDYGGRIISPLLLHGPPGTGKTAAARVIVRALTCRGPVRPLGDPCGQCQSCASVSTSRRWIDNDAVEIDCTDGTAQTIMDCIHDQAIYNPCFKYSRFDGGIVLLDEVHRSSGLLSDRLLKPVEETARTLFVLMTTKPGDLGPALRQRCVQVRFAPPTEAEATAWLRRLAASHGVEIEPGAIARIVQRSGCVPRQCLRVLEMSIALAGDQITESVVEEALCNF